MLMFTGRSFEEQLWTMVILGSILMIYGIVYLFQQHRKRKELRKDLELQLQQRKKEEEVRKT